MCEDLLVTCFSIIVLAYVTRKVTGDHYHLNYIDIILTKCTFLKSAKRTILLHFY